MKIETQPDVLRHIDVKRRHTADAIDDVMICTFRTLMDAILSQKAVSFTNRTKHGTLFKCSAAVPIKIEYAVISGRFSAFFWQMDPARLFKARLRNLSEIKVLDKISDSQRAEIADMIEHQKCPEPIEMH